MRKHAMRCLLVLSIAIISVALVVVLDCDLQHPPEKIPEMYALWEQGYEVIEGRKSSRGISLPHSIPLRSVRSP